MISAFKHIRLSGYNLLPQPQNGQVRLSINNTGIAYYSELTNISGVLVTSIASTGSTLDGKINTLSGYTNSTFATIANLANTGSNLQNQITNLNNSFTGFTGTLNATFATDNELSGASGVLVTLINSTGSVLDNKINSLSGYSNNTFATVTNLASTGSNLQGQITTLNNNFTGFTGNLNANFATTGQLGSLSGYSNSTFATITNLANTGSTLDSKINSLSGYSNNTFATITNLASTGSTLQNNINSLSGTLTGNYVSKASQQQFIVNLPINIESTGITYPVAFASVPNSVQVTFEPFTDVIYMVSVKNRTTVGFTADFSDIILETGNKLNVFASI